VLSAIIIDFLLSPPYTIVYGESIVFVKIFEFQFLVEISILGPPEPKKVVFRVMSVCVCVCVWDVWYLHGISRNFFDFFEFLNFNGVLPQKPIKNTKNQNFSKMALTILTKML
jgi:hypothetical protein